jgi:6-phosphofructokinase 1
MAWTRQRERWPARTLLAAFKMRIGVLTSGGDAPGMNAAIRAVVRQAIYLGHEVRGIRRGYQGLLDGQSVALRLSSVADIIKLGGTILHTARCPALLTAEGRATALQELQRLNIDGLVVIGGDGSLRAAARLYEDGFPVVGVPASIDNDIPGTDNALGFDTAINIVVEAMDRLRDTASAHERVFVIEVMGRDSGAIALSAGLAGGAEAILVPEVATDLDAIAERLIRSRARGKRHSLVVVAEGAGGASPVAEGLARRTGYEVRMTILGHLQRGGPPSAGDRILGSEFGTHAVEALLDGRSGIMVGWAQGAPAETELLRVAAMERRPNLSLARLAEILAT